MFDLTGRVALITGASSGLGVEMGKALAKQGAKIAICARRKEKLEKVAEEIRALGTECLAVVCDITKDEDIENLISQTVAQYGKIDILINNAGGGANDPSISMPKETLLKDINVDLIAPFLLTREVVKIMLKREYGRIINICSVHGLTGSTWSNNAAYKAAKGGLINLTRQFGVEWCTKGITCNAICPGFFPTEALQGFMANPNCQKMIDGIVPMKRIADMKDIDGAVVFLASEESAYVTGTVLPVDGGYTCV